MNSHILSCPLVMGSPRTYVMTGLNMASVAFEKTQDASLLSELFNALWLIRSSFLILRQMKPSWSFVGKVFLHSLNQPQAFCSACGVASVLACSSLSLHRILFSAVFWSWGKMLHNFWQALRRYYQEKSILFKMQVNGWSFEVMYPLVSIEFRGRQTCASNIIL